MVGWAEKDLDLHFLTCVCWIPGAWPKRALPGQCGFWQEPQTWSCALPTSRASKGTRLENRQMHICGEQICAHVYMCAKPEPTELCLLLDPRVQRKATAPLATKRVQTAADQASRRQSIRAVVLQEPSGVVMEPERTTTGPESKPGHALASETAKHGISTEAHKASAWLIGG